MGIQHAAGNMGYTPNTALTEEMTLSTSGISAESNADGVVANMVPKEGGNTFRGSVSGLFSGSKLQMDNLTDELRARGITTVNEVCGSGMRRSRWAARSSGTRSGSSACSANGAASVRARASSGT